MTINPSATPDQVGDFYDALGPLLSMVWDDNFHYGYWEGSADDSSVAEATDRFTDVLIDRLDVTTGQRVLDVGCGIGKPALRLAAATGAEVLGISINSGQVDRANERAHTAGLADRVRFEHADALALPFPKASFDAILALESIIHMDRRLALAEMARVLAPGGRLVLSDLTRPHTADPESGPAPVITSLVRLADYPALVAGAGLVLDELTDVSEYTRNTLPRLIENIQRHRVEFEARYGVDIRSIVAATTSSSVAPAEIGCLIMVAHRP